jgi:hypothetical protein
LEVCGDGIDNNCDGAIDEGCNSIPSVVAAGNPLSGVFPLDVSFNCQGMGGDGTLEYFWNFGNGDSSAVQNPGYTYLFSGDFSASCRVRDADGDEAFAFVDIEVGMQSLDIGQVVCFEEVIEGHNQSCSVYVEDSLGAGIGGVDVEVFYSDGSSFGSCLTDSISGACEVKDLQSLIGEYEVYAFASMSGYTPDEDGQPRFIYDVLEEKYKIVELSVYNDSSFLSEDYDFFRGEDLYVSFGVEDLEGTLVSDDLITNVSLVSSAGGRVDLERVAKVGADYYYELIPIPVTHEFFGDGNVFAFVFDIVDGSGGQEEVSLIIRNNLPVIFPNLPSRTVEDESTISVNLSLYESDVEDSGDALRWEVVSSESGVEVNLVGKLLFIEGTSEGNSEIVLRLYDLDNDYDEESLNVKVEEEDDDKDDSRCNPRWKCSVWSDCSRGFEDRTCVDTEGCQSSAGKPLEIKSCSSSSSSGGSGDMIGFGGASSGEEEFSFGWIFLGLLIFLILLMILFLIFLLRNR